MDHKYRPLPETDTVSNRLAEDRMEAKRWPSSCIPSLFVNKQLVCIISSVYGTDNLVTFVILLLTIINIFIIFISIINNLLF